LIIELCVSLVFTLVYRLAFVVFGHYLPRENGRRSLTS